MAALLCQVAKKAGQCGREMCSARRSPTPLKKSAMVQGLSMCCSSPAPSCGSTCCGDTRVRHLAVIRPGMQRAMHGVNAAHLEGSIGIIHQLQDGVKDFFQGAWNVSCSACRPLCCQICARPCQIS